MPPKREDLPIDDIDVTQALAEQERRDLTQSVSLETTPAKRAARFRNDVLDMLPELTGRVTDYISAPLETHRLKNGGVQRVVREQDDMTSEQLAVAKMLINKLVPSVLPVQHDSGKPPKPDAPVKITISQVGPDVDQRADGVVAGRANKIGKVVIQRKDTAVEVNGVGTQPDLDDVVEGEATEVDGQ